MLQPTDMIIKGKLAIDRSSHLEIFYKTGVKKKKKKKGPQKKFTKTPVLDSVSNNIEGL